MKTRWWAMAALPLLAAPGITGQQNGGSATQDNAPPARGGRLSRVADGRVADGRKDEQDAFDREVWRKRLSASDLEERERACDELGALARHNGEARKTLQEWSKEDQDRELAWTSRMLLREVDRSPLRGLHGRGSSGKDWLGSAFDFDDFSRRFEDLDSMFGDLRSEWGDMLRALPAPSSGSNSTSQSMSLQMGPDGVSCTVTENVDGKEEKRTYTAKSMDELLEAHPELRANLGGTQFHFFQGLPHGGWQGFTPGPRALTPRLRAFGDAEDVAPKGEPPLDRLGILCAEPGQDLAGELGLESGVGLVVQEVQPGTIASLLGIRSGDVVVEVDGNTIRGTEDVKKALKERASDADVSVVVVGDDAHRRTLTWKPKLVSLKTDAKAEKKAEKKAGSRDL